MKMSYGMPTQMHNNVSVTFNLSDKGIYLLDNNGATGKSYLGTFLECIASYDSTLSHRYVTFTSNDALNIIKYQIDTFTGDILILDRLDLYITDELVDTLRYKDCYVLADLKTNSWCKKIPYKLATVVRTPNSIEVREL